VVHVRHDRNCGLPGLRVNEGMELARGQYLAFQFDDDTWRPHALKALVTEMERHPEPVVIVGHCHGKGRAHEVTFPLDELNIFNLYATNLLANNSVLFPRHLINKYGMYDCHIAMRRICDWDLWLRFIKHVDFLAIDETVSDLYAEKPDSIMMTVPYDLPLIRYFQDIPRDHLLTPGSWRDYEVDGLRIGDVEIDNNLRKRLYEMHLLPYYSKFRHFFPMVEGFTVSPPVAPKTVLYIRNSYDATSEIAFNHYDALSNRRGNYKAFFQFFSQISPHCHEDAGIVILARPFHESGKIMCEQALAKGTPLGAYFDDDFLSLYEYGADFAFIAPNTPNYQNMVEIIKSADAVLVSNDFIGESVKRFNPRIVPHNGCAPREWLPTEVRSSPPGDPLRIGYVGASYRKEEFSYLWEALQRISQEFGDKLIFEFWGLDTSQLPELTSRTVNHPYIPSYPAFIEKLKDANFDILLTPLLDYPRPRLGKAPSKYYQTAVAGALGIFSDVPQYKRLLKEITCLKPLNTVNDWYEALHKAVTMSADQFDLLRGRMIEHVREEFTEIAQIHLHEAALRATEFHAHTRKLRHADGLPRVMFVFYSILDDDELQRLQWLRIMRTYGIEPILVLPKQTSETHIVQRLCETLTLENIQIEFVDYTCSTELNDCVEGSSEAERGLILDLFRRCNPSLVHTVTFLPSFGEICAELGIPHVASLYGVNKRLSMPNGRSDVKHCAIAHSDSLQHAFRWGELLGVEKFCAREVVPEEVFALGLKRHLDTFVQPLPSQNQYPPRIVLSGTIEEQKRQLEAIECMDRLNREGWDLELDIYGHMDVSSNYVEKCQQMVQANGLENKIRFRGVYDDRVMILRSADILLSFTTFESIPTPMKEAMAAGVLVVATPVGGIPELIVDGVSGILCAGTSVEAMVDGIRRALALTPEGRKRIIEQARRVARSEFHPHRTASDMLAMYNRAIDLTGAMKPRDTQPCQPSLTQQGAAQYDRVESPPNPPVSHLLVDGKMSYHLNPQHANWMGLDVLIGTHRQTARGVLRMRVLSETGHPLREVSVDLVHARDNDWLEFRFSPVASSACTPFVVEFTINDAGPQTRISFYENNPREDVARRLLRRAGIPLSGNRLYCRLRYEK
jgi:glycosyltransferase involved in cell wall biosynthesis